MKRICSLFFMLVLVGCGKDYDPDLNRPRVNTDLSVYVNRFVQVAESMGRPVALGRIQVDYVDDMEGWVIGKCYSGYMTPRVEINRSYWEAKGKWSGRSISNSDRESLVFHELGHCILGRGHDDRTIPEDSRLSFSIMNTYHLERPEYENNWNYYMRELFGLPYYFTFSAVSQFPNQYYENPGLVPIAPNSERVFCKTGSDCDDQTVSAFKVSPEDYEVVYSTSENELHSGFDCDESH